MAEMHRIVFNDRIDAALCGLYLLVVLSILYYAIRTCLEAYRAKAPTVREEPALVAAE
jgi:carbon starvation protein